MASNSYGNASVDTSADIIIADLTERRSVLLKNNGSAIVYVGFDSSVTSSNGFPLMPQDTMEIAGTIVSRGTVIYGISASGTQDIRYMTWSS